jgi:hypothetical protein
MSQNILAVAGAARPASRSTVKILVTSLLFLLLTHLPAFADHVHQLSFRSGTWFDTDLTALTNGPDASRAPMIAFYTTPNDQFHVYYSDTNPGDVHQLYFNGSGWSDQDLSAIYGAPPDVGGMAGFSIGNLQYVFYVDANNHVQELNYNNDTWVVTDLTAQTGGPNASWASDLRAFVTPGNQLHLYYTDNALDLNQLYFNGTSWSTQDLSSTYLRGAGCQNSSHIAGFAVENEQHLFCIGFGKHSKEDLLHIYYNNATWVWEDISTKTGDVKMYKYTGLDAFKVPNQSQFEVYAIAGNNHVNQYTHTENPAQWTDYDLSAGIGAPDDGGFPGGMVAIDNAGSYNLFYAPTTEVYQLFYYNSSWTIFDLTGGTGNADSNADMSGFAVKGYQYIFYMSND